MIGMTNVSHPRVETAVIGLVVLACADMTALADELRGLVASVDHAGEAIVARRFDTRAEEEIRLGDEAVITMSGAKIGLGDLKADDHRFVTVHREKGVATSVRSTRCPGRP